MYILKKVIPVFLKPRSIKNGESVKIMISNGKLSIDKNFKISEQPVCEDVGDNRVKYKIYVSFEDLMGVYDWKVSNFLGKDFSESFVVKVELIHGSNSQCN